MGSNHEQAKDGNGSPWSDNDFPDLFEKSETQEDDDTIALEEGDFAPEMEIPQAKNLKKSDIESIKDEEKEEPIQVVYESFGADMIDYDDVY